MHENDWSLIFFTLLTQLSVGVILYLTITNLFSAHTWQQVNDFTLLKSPHFIALMAISLASMLSFFHLGTPQHAMNAANNLASSWLSREILSLGVFGLCVMIIFLQFIFKWNFPFLQPLILILGSISGLMLVYVMSRIYMVSTIPAWNTWFTPFHFYMSAVILGGTVMSGILMVQHQPSEMLKVILRLIAILLVFQLIAAFIYKGQVVKFETAAIRHPDFTSGLYHTLYLIRLFIIVIAALFTAYLSLRVSALGVSYHAVIRFYFFVFFFVAVEEVIGRYLFYEGYFRVGV